MDPEDAHPAESRPPTVADLLLLCRALNAERARYLVVGGFAATRQGFHRTTMDIAFLVDGSLENQARVKKSLEVLPDKAVRELGDDDLPTFERPMKANSGNDSSGHESRSGALRSKMADEMFTMEKQWATVAVNQSWRYNQF